MCTSYHTRICLFESYGMQWLSICLRTRLLSFSPQLFYQVFLSKTYSWKFLRFKVSQITCKEDKPTYLPKKCCIIKSKHLFHNYSLFPVLPTFWCLDRNLGWMTVLVVPLISPPYAAPPAHSWMAFYNYDRPSRKAAESHATNHKLDLQEEVNGQPSQTYLISKPYTHIKFE